MKPFFYSRTIRKCEKAKTICSVVSLTGFLVNFWRFCRYVCTCVHACVCVCVPSHVSASVCVCIWNLAGNLVHFYTRKRYSKSMMGWKDKQKRIKIELIMLTYSVEVQQYGKWPFVCLFARNRSFVKEDRKTDRDDFVR